MRSVKQNVYFKPPGRLLNVLPIQRREIARKHERLNDLYMTTVVYDTSDN